MVQMQRRQRPLAPSVVPDEGQRAVLDSAARRRVVLGAPGTGKSTLAVELIAAEVAAGVPADACLLLAPTRLRAAALRDRVTERIRATSTEPLARTPQALGFGILRRAAALQGMPAPRLLSGPEQDVVLREILEGHKHGVARAPAWPESLREALGAKGFRNELRDLLMRAVEWDVDADRLAELGREHDRPEWVAAAAVLDEYDQVTALSAPGAYDPAWILGGAAQAMAEDPQLAQGVHAQVRLLVVDDAQELTHAGVRLLRQVVAGGARVVLIGDPDAAVQTFRGAEPGLFVRWSEEWEDADRHTLPVAHRLPEAITRAAARVVERIGAVGGTAHRAPEPDPRRGEVEVGLFKAVAQESAHIAAELRRARVMGGVPWSQMAVIVRGQSRVAALRRALVSADVPVAVPPTVVALRDEAAVRPFLQLFELVQTIVTVGAARPDAALVTDLLTSPLGGADAMTLRRLRRAMRVREIADGGERTSDELLVAGVVDDAWLTLDLPEAVPLKRVARVLRAGVDAWRAPQANAETVLWAMWSASGLAKPWEESALAGGPAGARADRDLDAMVALFGAAASYVDRLPASAPGGFLEHVLGQEVPGDRLVAAAPDDEAVALLTPQSAAGQEWAFVIVAGVQEGVWPDLRLRGSLLGSEALVDLLSGRDGSLRSAAAAVRYDETRQFLVALTRSSERLLVTAVRSEEEQPSAYLDLVDPLVAEGDSDPLREFTPVARGMTLRTAVAELRREAVDGQVGLAPQDAARLLGWLAREAVAGADPAGWWAFTELSDDRPRRDPDGPVEVSPSKVEEFGRCGLQWLLRASGGEGYEVGSADVGTLVHEIAAELWDAEPHERHTALDARWGRLGLGDGWLAQRTRDQAHEMLQRFDTFSAEAAAQGWRVVGIERGFAVTDGRVALRGRVDRLEQGPDGGLRVIDLKTGSSKPSSDELPEHPQLGSYQWAVEHGGFEESDRSSGAALVHLGKAGSASRDKSTDLLKHALQVQPPLGEDGGWIDERLRATAAGMGGSRFEVRLDEKACRMCQLKRCCPLQPEGGVV
ncbi:ATP-dependent helicase [Calidifontibacter sp. DB0510]|uniref:DNA 3'-5' helicase n=2 Tax=Metallococcus carri TaxID=1656884 RepID=A0A967B2S2_9MICO|nr:ATP-dependent helicase [Metallococcus carri]NOP36112.1 ATP-dependent helicase [Calidifontibacter sp. DB2511S]